MPRICFKRRKFSASSMEIIEAANEIIDEYMQAGLRMTLRQLYYQFVARDLIANTVREYKRLGSVINDARLAGLIDWDAIEDRTRDVDLINAWDNPPAILKAVAAQYKRDLWEGQEYQPEVWIEKAALAGVIAPICHELRVPHFACRGYTSQSEMWDSGYRRLRRYADAGRMPIIIHFGDHDPSGIDMTRDIDERLSMFFGMRIAVARVALNIDQIGKYKPPPNPAKQTDARFAAYRRQFGDKSWELDALEPTVLSALIRDNVMKFRNDTTWAVQEQREIAERSVLQAMSDQYDRLAKIVAK